MVYLSKSDFIMRLITACILAPFANKNFTTSKLPCSADDRNALSLSVCMLAPFANNIRARGTLGNNNNL